MFRYPGLKDMRKDHDLTQEAAGKSLGRANKPRT